jgi:hypothetical protein
MRTFARVSIVAIVAAVAFFAAGGGPAQAAVRFNVDVLWNPNPDDSAQVFLHVTNMAYPVPREQVTAVFHEMPDPYEDYPVLAFIAYNAHVDLGTVWKYKRNGHVWTNVMWHFGVPPSALFVDLPAPPGPPYGKAYGYWRKQRDKMPRDVISSDDIHYWVRMHAVANYAGVAPRQVYEWRRSGQRFETIASNQYRAKHGKGQGQQGAPGKGWGKAKGHDHGHD